MIIERRNQAATIVDYMHKQMIALRMDPFKRMFNTVVQEHTEFPDRYSEIQIQSNISNENFLAQHKKHFGFVTSGSGVTSRSDLLGTTMRQAIKYTGDTIRDKQTIDQLLSLLIKNGRVDHPPGGHDDLVICLLLSFWFLTNGRNLQYYGIPNNYVLSHNESIHSSSNKEEMFNQELTRRAKIHVEMLMNAIKKETDPNVIERLIHEVNYVVTELGPRHEVSISVDQMLSDIKKTKMVKSYAKRSMYN